MLWFETFKRVDTGNILKSHYEKKKQPEGLWILLEALNVR